jgi:uracil-DNA glycosylase
MVSLDYIHSEDWKTFFIKGVFQQHLRKVSTFIQSDAQIGKIIYPEEQLIFKAFELCPYEKVKVVLLGQDPYHNPGQANGLSFSVPNGLKIPPSLKNIFKEINSNLGIENDVNGNLACWASQGVLLLNAILTVNKNEPGAHRLSGWEEFTDEIIQVLSEEKTNLVFLLWGKFAQEKAHFIDENKHLVLEAAHPSPFSAYRGFFGCQHFSKTNAYLSAHGKEEIDWKV